jgi:hypothetical protein
MRRRCAPEAKRVDRLAAVADDWTVIRHADQRGGIVRHETKVSVAQLDRAAELDLDALGRAYDLPWVRMTQPIVRPFLLPAIVEALLEHAVLVAQTVPGRRQRHGRHRIEKTGRQPPETAIAEARVGLLVQKLHPLPAPLVERLVHHRVEHEIHDVVGKRAANQELDRDVIDPFRILAFISLIGPDPPLRENVPGRARRRVVALARVGGRRVDDVVELEMPFVKRIRRASEHRRAATIVPEDCGCVRGSLS